MNSNAVLVALLAISFVPFAITMLKGKFSLGLISLFAGGPLVTIVGAVRLAKPVSWWATRLYDDSQMARSQARFPQADAETLGRPAYGMGGSEA